MRRLCRVNCSWTPQLAYVVGVITADGNLSPDGRHINITSKDRDMLVTIRSILDLTNTIGTKSRGGLPHREYFVLQFGDVNFYEFLLSIGLTPAKSKTVASLAIPRKYFRDFLRGCIDGDGNIGSFSHPKSKQIQIKVRLASASPAFLKWVLLSIRAYFAVSGGSISKQERKGVSSLSFGKADSLQILRAMYYSQNVPALERKREVAKRLLEKYST